MEIDIIKNSHSLYLDRDGVINKKKNDDYIKSWDEFVFIDGSLKAISALSNIFKRIFIVTNQRGIGKGIMTDYDLKVIHERMISEIKHNKGRIDRVYYCSDTNNTSINRKPNPGMAIESKKDFIDIDFNKSFMVGDQISDIEFGNNLGMKTVLIGDLELNPNVIMPDYKFSTLLNFSQNITTI